MTKTTKKRSILVLTFALVLLLCVALTSGVYTGKADAVAKSEDIFIDGAGIYIGTEENEADKSGIRFKVVAKKSVIENEANTVGAILVPADMVTGDEVKIDTENAVNNVLASEAWKASESYTVSGSETDSYMESYVYLYNFPASDYNRVILANAYVFNGESYKHAGTVARSMSEVALEAVNDGYDEASRYIKSYNVNFYGADGVTEISGYENVTQKYGEALTEPSISDEKFQGFFADKECTVPFDFTDYVVKGTVNVYSKWITVIAGNYADFDLQDSADYTFEFVAGKIDTLTVGGTEITDFTQDGATVTIPNTTVKGLGTGEKEAVILTESGFTYKTNVTIATMVISDKSELDKFHDVATANSYGGYYVLDNNIDYSGATWTSIFSMYNSSWGGGHRFTGTFDGRGYGVYDMVIGTTTGIGSTGFIGCIEDGAVVKNIGFIDPVITVSENEYGVASIIVGVIHRIAEVNNTFVYISDAATSYMVSDGRLTAGMKMFSAVGDRPNDMGGYVRNSVVVIEGSLDANIDVCICNNINNLPIIPDNTYVIASSAITSKYETDKNFATVEAFKSAGGATELSTDVWDLSGDYPVLKNIEYSKKVAIDAVDFDLQDSEYTVNVPDGTVSEVIIGGTVISGTSQSGNTLTIPKAGIETIGTGEKIMYIKTDKATYVTTATIATMVISDVEELNAFNTTVAAANDYGGYYVLDSNIDYNGGEWKTTMMLYNGPDWGYFSDTSFRGTFDGRGYVISNMKFIACSELIDGMGFLGSNVGIVKNLGFIDPVFDMKNTARRPAVIGGQLQGGTVMNIFVEINDASKVWVNPGTDSETSEVYDRQKIISITGARLNDTAAYVYDCLIVVKGGTLPEGVTFAVTSNKEIKPLTESHVKNCFAIGNGATATVAGSEKAYTSVEEWKAASDKDLSTYNVVNVWDLSGDYPVLKNYVAE